MEVIEKICRLINSGFSWAMYVDGKVIRFNGKWEADYFAEHYEGLGYKIEWDKSMPPGVPIE